MARLAPIPFACLLLLVAANAASAQQRVADGLAFHSMAGADPMKPMLDVVPCVSAVGDTRATGRAIARRIPRSTPAADAPLGAAPLVPVSFGRELQRRPIDQYVLTRDTKIPLRPSTAWDGYGVRGSAAVGVVAAQSVLIAMLLSQRRRRLQAEDALRAREATLSASCRRSRRLARRLMQAQESARVAMARQLHDGICQDMVGVAMAIDDVTNSGGRIQDARTQYALAKLHRRAIEIADGIRLLSHELYPASLQLLGLAAAVKSYCLEIEKRHDVEISLQTAGDLKRISPDGALCLFRIAQEALRNAVAHSGARRLQVSVVRRGAHVELSVVDHGKGFDVESVRGECRGLGLASLEERAHGAGGELRITSMPGQGSSITAHIPAGEPFDERFGDGAKLAPGPDGAPLESSIAEAL